METETFVPRIAHKQKTVASHNKSLPGMGSMRSMTPPAFSLVASEEEDLLEEQFKGKDVASPEMNGESPGDDPTAEGGAGEGGSGAELGALPSADGQTGSDEGEGGVGDAARSPTAAPDAPVFHGIGGSPAAAAKNGTKTGNSPQGGDSENKYSNRKVEKLNKAWWKKLGLYLVDPFEGLTPFTDPEAYAEYTYKIQTFMLATPNGKFGIDKANGILDKGTFQGMERLARFYLQQEGKSAIEQAELDPWFLERLAKILPSETKNPPLTSNIFASDVHFNLINRFKAFTIKRGEAGRPVALLQIALKEMSYLIGEKGVDGDFGKATKQGLKNFQIDSGLAGKYARGVLDHKTIQILDQRFNAKAHRDKFFSVGKGGSIGAFKIFNVPVPEGMSADKFKAYALGHIFGQTQKEGELLVNQGWKIVVADSNGKDGKMETFALNAGHLKAKFVKIALPAAQYAARIGELNIEKNGPNGESAKETVEKQMLYLQDKGKLWESTKAISKAEKKLNAWKHLKQNPQGAGHIPDAGKEVAKYEKELATHKADQKLELKRLGISEEEFFENAGDFQIMFEQYAVEVGREMLRENKTLLNIDKGQYQKEENLQEMQGLFQELQRLYAEADKQWLMGVAEELFGSKSLVSKLTNLSKELYNKLLLPYDQFRLIGGSGNKHLDKCRIYEKKAHQMFVEGAKKYRMLAFPDLEIREDIDTWAGRSPGEIGEEIKEEIGEIDGNINATAKDLNAENVWKLEPVLVRAKHDLGIVKGSVQDKILDERQADRKPGLGLTVLGLALGFAALISGPIGWASLTGSVVIGGVEAFQNFRETSFLRNAADTAPDQADALSKTKPGWGWFAVNLLTLGLDVGAAVKIANAIGKSKNVLLKGEALIAEAKAEIEVLKKAGKLNAAQAQKSLKVLENVKTMQRLELFAKLSDPLARQRLAKLLDQPALENAILGLQKGLDGELFDAFIQFAAGQGGKYMDELPEVFRMAQAAGLQKNSALMQEILMQPRVQNFMLEEGTGPLVQHHKAWLEKTAAGPVQLEKVQESAFSEFLRQKKGVKNPKANKTTLKDELSDGFEGLEMHQKNQQILGRTERHLVDALNAGTVPPPALQAALQELLSTDIIQKIKRLDVAEARVRAKVQDVIIQHTKSWDDYQRLVQKKLVWWTEAKDAVRNSVIKKEWKQIEAAITKPEDWKHISNLGESEILNVVEKAFSLGQQLACSREEIIFAIRYKTLKRSASVHDIVRRFRNGERINPQTGMLYFPGNSPHIDILAGGKKTKTLKTSEIKPGTVDTEIAELDTLKKIREAAITERDKHGVGAAAYKKAQQEVNNASENLGEKAAEIYMRTKFKGRNPKKLYPLTAGKPGSGNLDQVWEVGNQIYVVEAKGGTSPLSSRLIAKTGLRAQQGSLAYIDDITEAMVKAGGAKKKIAGIIRKRLSSAGGNKPKLKSMSVRQPIDRTTGELKPIEATIYDLGKDTPNPRPE